EGDETENRKIVKLAKYLPENTFTRIPRRLYIFKGSELAISPEMVVEYVKIHSQQNGGSSGSVSECLISECSSSESSENEEDDNDDFIACVLQRCRGDPILEAERKRCLKEEEEVEVITCDESPSENGTIGTIHSENPSNSNGPEANKMPSSESSNGGPTEAKRRKTSEDSEGEERPNNCPAKAIDITSNSVSDEKTVNGSQV
ncbi:unnamed protein product, partial [Hymenolepis diminuta]